MADVQAGSGYVRIANSLFEALMRIDVPALHKSLMFAVIRLTYGYNKKQDRISIGQIAELVGRDPRTTRRGMNDLASWSMLTKQSLGERKVAVWGVQKDFDQWRPGPLSSDAIRKRAERSSEGDNLGGTSPSESSESEDHLRGTVPPNLRGTSEKSEGDCPPTPKTTKDRKTQNPAVPMKQLPELTDKWLESFTAAERNGTGRPIPPHRIRIWLAWCWNTQGMDGYGYTRRGFKQTLRSWLKRRDRFRRDGEPSAFEQAEAWYERLLAHNHRASQPEPEDSASSPSPGALADAEELLH